jgi:SpoIID/LytB domain protein
MRAGIAIATAGLLAAAAAAGTASAASVLVVTGRGWGHGVGMSQWGAHGYAAHGWGYRRILAHYYPGTELGQVTEPRVRVLLEQDRSVVTIGCASRMSVSDATGLRHPLRAGTYGVGPRLVLPVGRQLRSPVVVECQMNPLALDGRSYHGLLVLRSAGGRLSVVNSLPLDTYLRGVVGAEMPSDWAPAALEAQAVAARSYAIATLHPSAPFDLFPDDRSQTYTGIAAETPATDLAVAETKGQVLTWDGRVATTFYSSSSGGRTDDVRDYRPDLGAVPYLRSVLDPYDRGSPHHEWKPSVFTPQELAARLGVGGAIASVRIERSRAWRVDAVELELDGGGTARLDGKRVEEALGLRSKWYAIDELNLSTESARVLYGHGVGVDAQVTGGGVATLERRSAGGAWQVVRTIHGRARVLLAPQSTTEYRLSMAGVRGPEASIEVVPRIRVHPLTPALLAGEILPRPTAAVTVWRRERKGWRVVAHPRVDAGGSFRSPVRLLAGDYRIAVASDGRLGSAVARFRISGRMLASLPGAEPARAKARASCESPCPTGKGRTRGRRSR